MDIMKIASPVENVLELNDKEKKRLEEITEIIWDKLKDNRIFKSSSADIIVRGNTYVCAGCGIWNLSPKGKKAMTYYDHENIEKKKTKKKIEKICSLYGDMGNQTVIMSCDQSLTKNFKKSFVLTDNYIHIRQDNMDTRKIELKRVDRVTADEDHVYINGDRVMSFPGINKDIAELLEFGVVLINHGVYFLDEDNEISIYYKDRYEGDN